MKKQLEGKLKNKLEKDIITFFYTNQGSIDTVSGVAAWVHEDKKKVKKALESLVEIGVLEYDSTGAAKGYCYTRDKETMKIIKKVIETNE